MRRARSGGIRQRDRPRRSEVAVEQIVGASATARIDLDGGRVDPCTIRIESAEQAGLVVTHVRLNPLQRVLCDEERDLHGAVVAPETYGATRRIEDPALVWKA